jgi:hypothetical protein
MPFHARVAFHKAKRKAPCFLDFLHGAFSFAKIVMISSSSFLPSLVSGASQQLSVFMLAHLLLALLDNTPHSITSIL